MEARYIDRKKIGQTGEDIAATFLVKRGYSIIARNYRKVWGEIDILAEKNNTVRFVEVKTISVENVNDVSREKNTYRPEEQVHPFKLKKIARTAEIYMNSKKDDREYQIDVVSVFLDLRKRIARCRLFEQVL